MNGIRTRKHTTKFSKINALISTYSRKLHVLKIDCQNFWESWSPCLAICFFFFCETRCALGDIGLEGGHALYTSREPTNNAGVAILAHNDRVVKVNEIPVCAQDFVCRNQLVLSPHTRSMLDTISAFWMSFMTIWIPLWKMVAAGVMN